jgi:hypothetical protein
MAGLRADKLVALKERKVVCGDTWSAIAKTVGSFNAEAVCASETLTSVAGFTSSTSYSFSASSGDTGSPLQITESGSMGGMNSVSVSVGIA